MKYDPLMDSDKINDQNKLEAARRFLDNITWVYENIQERGNAPRDGRHNRITIRRFAPGAPQSCVREVLDLLTQQAPYQDPVISNAVVPGKWKPKLSWFRKDSRYETVNYKTASVTLIQELVPADEEGDSETFYGGGDCFREVSYQYFWEATEVVVPENEVGVLYNAGGVNRDDESGLFNYYVSKQVSIEHHEDPYVARIQNSSVVWVETWKNMRDLPEGLPEDDKVEIDGKVIEVSRKRNEDCTWDITKQTTETLAHDALEACKRTLTEHQHTKQTGGNETPLKEAPVAGGGKYYEYSSKKEDDGTYTNSETVTCEIPVSEVSVSKEGSLYGTRVTTQSKNQASPPTGEPGIGETVQFAKTPGGLYDVTKVCVIVTNPGCTEDTRQTTISESVCSITKTEEEKGDEQATAVNGVRVAHSYNMNQYGTWEHKETTSTEIPVSECMIAKSISVDGVTVQRTDINQPAGTQWEVSKVGESVRVEKTPGGLLNITKTTIDINTDIVKEVTDSETAFQNSHRKTTVKAAPIPGLDGPGSYKDAGGGKVYTGSSALLDSGAYQNTEATTTEYNVESAVTSTTKNALGTHTVELHKSRETGDASWDEDTRSVKVSLTDGRRYDVEITKFEPKSPMWTYTSDDNAFVSTTTTEKRFTCNAESAPLYGSSSVVLEEEDGSYRVITTTRTGKEQSWSYTSQDSGDGSSTKTEVARNTSSIANASAGRRQIASAESRLNELGKFDTEKATTTAPEAWLYSKSFDLMNGRSSAVMVFSNQDDIPYWEANGKVSDIRMNVNKNRFGLLDGSVTVEWAGSGGSGGSGGSDDDDDDDDDGSTVLGSTVVPKWDGSASVRSTTTEFYSGVAYDVTWTGTAHFGYTSKPDNVIPDNAWLSMPGGVSGGLQPFSKGAYYMYFLNVSRESTTIVSGSVDANGAPAGGVSS